MTMWEEIQKAQKQVNEGFSFFGQKTSEIIGGQTANVPPCDNDDVNGGSSVAGQKKNEAIAGLPSDNISIPPVDNTSTSPNIQSGPSKMSDWMKEWITFSEFVKRVFDNEDIFAKYELGYLKRNSSGLAEQKKAEEKIEEMAKKMNEEIYEEISKDHNNDWGTENPFEDRNDWRRIISSDGTNTQPPMFTGDTSDTIPMMEKAGINEIFSDINDDE